MNSAEQGWFTATDGRSIFYRATVPDAPKAILLVAHGYAEHSGRYEELMQFFSERGLACFAQDHRGHGRSARTLGDLESMAAVLGDFAVLHRRALERHPGLPVYLFGHSMGGLICTLYGERTDHLQGAIINGAALDIPDDISPVVVNVGRVLARIAPRLGVQKFYDPHSLTHDQARVAQVEADPLFYKGWMRARTGNEMLKSIRAAVADLNQLTLPFFATHGSKDRTVPPRTTDILLGGAASADKRAHFFEGMLHEVHNEPGRDEVFATWWSWLEPRL